MKKEQAKKLLAEAEVEHKAGRFALRSCGNCNSAHKHLMEDDGPLFVCIDCGHWFLKGHDLTKLVERWT